MNSTRRQRELITSADFLLELEPSNPFDLTTARDARGNTKSIMKAGSKRATISSVDLFMKSNYQDFQRFASDIDIPMAGDSEATLPFLIEEVKKQLPADRRSALQARGQRLAQACAADLGRSKAAAAFGWDDTPISTARLYTELYNVVKDDDWSLVSDSSFQSRWPQQLWKGDKHYQYIGGHGAAGIGYLAPAGLGAALANKKHGRLSISVVGDGDLMFGPGILWTAAHERIPILYIVHNNRGYHMEIMQMQVISNRRQRGADRVRIGCEITDPNINYAQMAKGLGVYSEGPVENPRDLAAAIQRAVAVVKKGEPALIDVVSQPR